MGQKATWLGGYPPGNIHIARDLSVQKPPPYTGVAVVWQYQGSTRTLNYRQLICLRLTKCVVGDHGRWSTMGNQP